ncbi:MAG: hypothetical protein MZW92_77575 [Comamonadaceae bacterium]|nr:hypothetical protein [Comamonadaceae bacterium]
MRPSQAADTSLTARRGAARHRPGVAVAGLHRSHADEGAVPAGRRCAARFLQARSARSTAHGRDRQRAAGRHRCRRWRRTRARWRRRTSRSASSRSPAPRR